MSITSTYRLDSENNLVETEGGMFDPVLDVVKSPIDIFSAEANNTYVTKRRSATTTLIGGVLTAGAALWYDARRAKNGKQPLLASFA